MFYSKKLKELKNSILQDIYRHTVNKEKDECDCVLIGQFNDDSFYADYSKGKEFKDMRLLSIDEYGSETIILNLEIEILADIFDNFIENNKISKEDLCHW